MYTSKPYLNTKTIFFIWFHIRLIPFNWIGLGVFTCTFDRIFLVYTFNVYILSFYTYGIRQSLATFPPFDYQAFNRFAGIEKKKKKKEIVCGEHSMKKLDRARVSRFKFFFLSKFFCLSSTFRLYYRIA